MSNQPLRIRREKLTKLVCAELQSFSENMGLSDKQLHSKVYGQIRYALEIGKLEIKNGMLDTVKSAAWARQNFLVRLKSLPNSKVKTSFECTYDDLYAWLEVDYPDSIDRSHHEISRLQNELIRYFDVIRQFASLQEDQLIREFNRTVKRFLRREKK